MISYSQNFEDVMAGRLFPPEYRGFYIDIGAADPVFLSVTKHFYDSGWHGVNVEPLGSAHQKLVEARPRDINLNVIVGRESGSGRFFEISDYPENSTSDQTVMRRLRKEGHSVRTHEVEMLSLRDLCDRYVGSRTIDFLKIDVEGGELPVIEGGNWTKYRPVLLIIEAVEVNGRKENWETWEPAIHKAGYIKVHFDGLNNFYLREESQELSDRFRLPPNLFDGIEVLRPDQCAAQIADNQAYHADIISDLQSQLLAARTQITHRQAEQDAALAALEASRGALEQEHGRHVEASTILTQGQSEQLEHARAEIAWLRAQLSTDGDLLRDQLARHSAITDELARQHARQLEKSELQSTELQRRLESELELVRRIAGVEADRERIAQLLKAAQAQCALVTRQLADTRAEREAIREQVATAQAELERVQAQRSIETSEARELQRWFEQALLDGRAATAMAESVLGERNAELLHLRHQLAALHLNREEATRQSEAAAAEREAHIAQAKLDCEIRLQAAVAWLSEGHTLLHRLSVKPDHWIVRLARNFTGKIERDRQAELGETAARLSAAVTDLMANRMASKMSLNMTKETCAHPVRGAQSLDELLSFADRAFVRCAFVTLLGRDADPVGEAYYLARLRRGFAKLSLLKQLRRSPEGRANDPGIAGLDRAIARNQRANMALIGWLIRSLSGEEGDNTAIRRLRAIENRIASLQDQLSAVLGSQSEPQR